nr:hypothetical protein [Zhihengliuella halotolerans]
MSHDISANARDQMHIVRCVSVRLLRVPLAEVREVLGVKQTPEILDEPRTQSCMLNDLDRDSFHTTLNVVIPKPSM